MKALVSREYGPVEDLVITDLPTPVPTAGQILLKVQAAALNPLDVKLSTGEMREHMPVKHPFLLGLDATGIVEAVGPGVTNFAVGDEVVAFTYGAAGALAEYTLANDGPNVVRRPAGLDAVRAAALPVAGMTAHAVLTAAAVNPGDSVLVVGATGGVGSFVVQLAAHAGAQVLATAGPSEADYVRGLGAQEIIDYTSGDTAKQALALRPGGVDVVIDLVNAGPGLAATAAAAKPGGRLVSPLGGQPEFDRGVGAVYTGVEGGFGKLQDLVDRAAAGTFEVEVGATHPFSSAVDAVGEFATKHTRGKVVITF
ncbi:NADP-dependent oxidoreductase [Nonomuraea angiospora]|uniref:NADPH:quinone reductase-like Zn-dependent oxidoreductase n=1 Tax=Nonomuraea angiospora TaxID=46172 RepID=A0ABR9ML44_9ACTN|nr:NADP-dependent oxidoreductase [Nonomuraea angiospora]MBE1593340.1 NADPH:quinone reductase-like Zn-dependent oxidoreductase [Nonomuraea angiospora]